MSNNPTPHCEKACPYTITVQDIRVVKNVANCFVHVQPTNTTYYVDESHKVIVIYAGPVYYTNYNYIENPLGLTAQTCYDFTNQVAYHFDENQKCHIIKLNLEEVI